VTGKIGDAVTEAEAAALLITRLNAVRLDAATVPGWTTESTSVAELITELVLRMRVAEAKLADLERFWGPWATPAGPGASEREFGYRAAAAQIHAQLKA
jgi:hypothetical protein